MKPTRKPAYFCHALPYTDCEAFEVHVTPYGIIVDGTCRYRITKDGFCLWEPPEKPKKETYGGQWLARKQKNKAYRT